jgi:hypothetical protein
MYFITYRVSDRRLPSKPIIGVIVSNTHSNMRLSSAQTFSEDPAS